MAHQAKDDAVSVATLKTSCNFWTIAADNQTEAACIESLNRFPAGSLTGKQVEV